MDVKAPKSRSRTDRGRGHLNIKLNGHGFTLLELMAVLGVMSILFSIAIPSFSQLLASERNLQRMNNLAVSLSLTRSEAIKRNQHVVICKSPDQQYCQRKGVTWHSGWIVFVDRDHDRRRSDEEPLIHAQGSGNPAQQLTYAAFGSRHYVVYRPTGMTRTNGTFTLCDSRYPGHARALILTKTGRVRSSRVKSNGDPLDC